MKIYEVYAAPILIPRPVAVGHERSHAGEGKKNILFVE